ARVYPRRTSGRGAGEGRGTDGQIVQRSLGLLTKPVSVSTFRGISRFGVNRVANPSTKTGRRAVDRDHPQAGPAVPGPAPQVRPGGRPEGPLPPRRLPLRPAGPVPLLPPGPDRPAPPGPGAPTVQPRGPARLAACPA